MLHAISDGTPIIDYVKSVDILKALHMLKRAWFLVLPTTIENCFRKAGFFISDDIHDVDEMQKVFDASEFGEAIQEEDFEAFVDCDKAAECFGNLKDAEICDSIKQNREEMVDLEDMIEKNAFINRTQSKITDFFFVLPYLLNCRIADVEIFSHFVRLFRFQRLQDFQFFLN